MSKRIFVVLLALGACASPARSEPAPIIGGTAATATDLRSTVGVRWHIAGPDGFVACTGTVIAPTLVVTAAHCVTRIDSPPTTITQLADATAVEVVAGTLAITEATPAQTFAVARIAVHPGYPGTFLESDPAGIAHTDDVAVLVLARPMDIVTPTPVLPLDQLDTQVPAGTPLLIEGYGDSEMSHTTLFFASTPFVRHGDTQMLIGGTGTPDACDGDSGGPAYLEGPGGRWLIGIASRKRQDFPLTGCGQGTLYSLAPAYLGWIESVTGEVTADGGVILPDAGMTPAPAASCGCRASTGSRSSALWLLLAWIVIRSRRRLRLDPGRSRRSRSFRDRRPSSG